MRRLLKVHQDIEEVETQVRQLTMVSEGYDAETQDRRDEQAEQDEQDKQQARTPLLIFSELQRTMDPIVAARVYNERFCPLLSRLPNEILLCIFEFLRDDPVALYCLRIVSKTTFHLLNKHRRGIWGHRYPRWNSVYLTVDEGVQFRQLIQRDGRCSSCRRWYDERTPLIRDKCQFQPAHKVVKGASNQRMLYCYPCDNSHDISRFFSLDQQPLQDQMNRSCLGQQGSVQLCQHVHITWARIKVLIDIWRQQHQQQGGEEEWRTCFDGFKIECHNPIHDTRCTASEAPTWPRARLCINTNDPSLVILNLEWTPQRRIDSITLTTDGRMPTTELRAMFHKLRALGPADTLYPASCRNPLPEMAFFSPSSSFGPFVCYKIGENDGTGPPPVSSRRLPSHPSLRLTHYPLPGAGQMDLSITSHYIGKASTYKLSSQCLVVSYKKDIIVCKTRAIANPHIKIDPSHQWLHAMDIQTYPRPQASHVRPECAEATCVNYCQRRKEFCLTGEPLRWSII